MAWTRASASQFATWNMCNRRWFFDHIRELRDTKGSPATELGKAVHSDIEAYIRGDSPGLSHPLLAANTFVERVKRLKAAGVEVRVEQEFYDEDLPALGFIDLVVIDHAAKRAFVIDHKTSGNLKYRKTALELETDDQAVLYCHVVASELPGYRIFFGHHVIPTKEAGPELLTLVDMPLFKISAGRVRQLEQIAEMKRTMDKQAHQVAMNKDACFKFPPRGCPHKSYCNSAMASLESAMNRLTAPAARTVVYLDCMPTRGNVVHWDAWVADLADAYAREVGEHYLMTKYNEGAKAVAAKAFEREVPAGLVLRSSDPAALLFSNFVRGDARYELVVGVR